MNPDSDNKSSNGLVMNNILFKNSPRVRVFVIDPRKFQQSFITQEILPDSNGIPKPATKIDKIANGNGLNNGNSQNGNSSNGNVNDIVRKRKLNEESNNEVEDNDDLEVLPIKNEAVVTRTGRVSKPNFPNLNIKPTVKETKPIDNSNGNNQSLVTKKKRKPPEKFRCQVCNKIYLGHTKLNLHHKKFPDHNLSNVQNSRKNTSSQTQMKKILPALSQNILSGMPTNFTTTQQSIQQAAIISSATNTFSQPQQITITIANPEVKAQNINGSTLVHQNSKNITNTILPSQKPNGLIANKIETTNIATTKSTQLYTTNNSHSHSPLVSNNSFIHPVMRRDSQNQNAYIVNSIKQQQPKLIINGHSNGNGNNSANNGNNELNPTTLTVPITANTNSNICHSFVNHNHQNHFTSVTSSGQAQTHPQNQNIFPNFSSETAGNFSGQVRNINSERIIELNQQQLIESQQQQQQIQVQNTQTIVNNININGNNNTNNNTISPNTSQQGQTPKSQIQSKSLWDFVEEKMISLGINQMLCEMNDVAEKLSKIARDKIIPIREEEEETLNSSSPIIHVDNPFLSHLMDLPFGTYIFREETMRRVAPTPPTSTESAAELSLTGGVEVDIDNFLSPDDLINLPHLTNLDFAAICNN